MPVKDDFVSQEDMNFLSIMNEEVVQLNDGYYYLSLPLKQGVDLSAYNYKVVLHRLHCLQSKFAKSASFERDYKEYMNSWHNFS